MHFDYLNVWRVSATLMRLLEAALWNSFDNPGMVQVSGPLICGLADNLSAHRKVFLTTLGFSAVVCSRQFCAVVD